ncbi:MAG: hypothetical protein B7X57_07280 [Erythrobacter sp. 34-65-8]|nr:MAG: hypothetical protein B7X57_07280 [Erythrobacter sp. 34-65-8]
MPDFSELEKDLKARLADLNERVGDIEEDMHQPLDRDLEDQAIEIADDDSQVGVELVLEQEIAQVQAALHRIAQGTYGFCTVCGEEIGYERLKARPIATRCIEHAV